MKLLWRIIFATIGRRLVRDILLTLASRQTPYIMSTKALCESTRTFSSPRTIQRALDSLVDRGELEVMQSGKYCISAGARFWDSQQWEDLYSRERRTT